MSLNTPCSCRICSATIYNNHNGRDVCEDCRVELCRHDSPVYEKEYKWVSYSPFTGYTTWGGSLDG